MYRCTCGHSVLMSTNEECVCCMEIDRIVSKINELGDEGIDCITNHPGFDPVCLNAWVLQTSYYQCRQEHGRAGIPPSTEVYTDIQHIAS